MTEASSDCTSRQVATASTGSAERPSNDSATNATVISNGKSPGHGIPAPDVLALNGPGSSTPRQDSTNGNNVSAAAQTLAEHEDAARWPTQVRVIPVQARSEMSAPQPQHSSAPLNPRPLASAPPRGQNWAHDPPSALSQQSPPPPPLLKPPEQMLMHQCPRCFLRAGEPFQPWYFPPAQPTNQHAPPAAQTKPTAAPLPQSKPVFSNTDQPARPPPDHPNSHLWVPPSGYQPAPSVLAPPAPIPPHDAQLSAYHHPSFPPTPAGYWVQKWQSPRPTKAAATYPSDRLPTPPPAVVPITLVDDAHPRPLDPQSGRKVNPRRKTDKPYHRRLNRDERRDILLMRRLGYKMQQIASYIGATVSAVSYTLNKGDPEPKHKNAGRKIKIPEQKVDEMVAYVEDYMAREKVCGIDKRNGRKLMRHLTYKMIREQVFADELGNIPKELKFSDDALKATLNRRGVHLRPPRPPMPEHQKELARTRGKRLWQEKLERDRLEAEGVAERAGDEAEAPDNAYTEVNQMEEDAEGDEDQDDPMSDADGEEDAISISSDDDIDDGVDNDVENSPRAHMDAIPGAAAHAHQRMLDQQQWQQANDATLKQHLLQHSNLS